jgi:regulator of cell morphogenesis and NO signaling
MQINHHTKLAEIIHTNYGLLPVLNRFNIYLGFGDKTVNEICIEKKVNIDFFLEIVNSFNDTSYFPQVRLQAFPLKLITEYINRSHEYYLDHKVPEIEQLIEKLLFKSEHKKDYALVDKFYKEYKNELIAHIKREEDEIIPYVLMLEEAFSGKRVNEEIKRRIKQNSINTYADDHDNVEDKLYDLKNLLIKYLPPPKDYTISNSLLFELFRLERDLNDHARIEDKVLVPKVQQLEEEILGM